MAVNQRRNLESTDNLQSKMEGLFNSFLSGGQYAPGTALAVEMVRGVTWRGTEFPSPSWVLMKKAVASINNWMPISPVLLSSAGECCNPKHSLTTST